MLNPQRLQALEKWQKENKIKLAQVNGQRKYGGPPDEWEGPTPGVGCEVFISQFPRETYEDRLIPLFSGVGPLWEFRLMMNFSGQNRGFAYAKYGTRAMATDAISRLHGYELEPGVYLVVRHSTEKRQLCVGELPASTQWAELLQVLMNLTEGVEGLSLKSGPDIKGVSALVIYVSHHAASMAKKDLGEGFKKLFSLRVSIKWQHAQHKIKTAITVRAPQLPPRLQHPRTATTFNRAVGAPVSPQPPPPEMPLSLLRQLCEESYGAKPVMKLECSHVDPGGTIHFTTRRVCLASSAPSRLPPC
ncbi:Dead end protein 1 [Merluccius polli]|uniref:Dead end protein 1 n=1 Tax=Merluccius polli TaxID=89951 RepID=A0AA47M552_MERPO|nr:Dead end protein 1 [Merluccius polli]KAK0151134.1 Dead end protein 1 [Merluccius polli]